MLANFKENYQLKNSKIHEKLLHFVIFTCKLQQFVNLIVNRDR